MTQLWLVLHGLRRSVLEAFLYQISPESITTNHRVEQKCDGDANKAEDEDGGRAALKCGQLWGGRHPNSSLSLEAGFLFPVLLWEWLSQQLWASYITSGFPFSLLKMRLPLFCLCSSAGRTVTVCKVLQRATDHYVRFILEMRGLASKTHLLSYYRSCESWNRCSAVCREGIQVGP